MQSCYSCQTDGCEWTLIALSTDTQSEVSVIWTEHTLEQPVTRTLNNHSLCSTHWLIDLIGYFNAAPAHWFWERHGKSPRSSSRLQSTGWWPLIYKKRINPYQSTFYVRSDRTLILQQVSQSNYRSGLTSKNLASDMLKNVFVQVQNWFSFWTDRADMLKESSYVNSFLCPWTKCFLLPTQTTELCTTWTFHWTWVLQLLQRNQTWTSYRDSVSLTRTSLLYKVTGTEVIRVDGDGFLPNPELSAGLLIGDRIDLHLLPWNAWGKRWQREQWNVRKTRYETFPTNVVLCDLRRRRNLTTSSAKCVPSWTSVVKRSLWIILILKDL